MTALVAACLVNAASLKSLEIQAYSITKPRTLLKRKFVWKLVFSCSNASGEVYLLQSIYFLKGHSNVYYCASLFAGTIDEPLGFINLIN